MWQLHGVGRQLLLLGVQRLPDQQLNGQHPTAAVIAGQARCPVRPPVSPSRVTPLLPHGAVAAAALCEVFACRFAVSSSTVLGQRCTARSRAVSGVDGLKAAVVVQLICFQPPDEQHPDADVIAEQAQ